ncbi:hypothetical protein CFR71_12570 [Novacetimonas pomaceti]|uniref:Uncharacterized protein n=1 Tax=Novacetimonas pomaceti TaxID=2021998 RepID=A0A318Q5L5_9PROT|nr:hypothetical protein CFR71_12570 [Novacetimonas pomaceti]
MIAVERWIMAANDLSVLSLRMAFICISLRDGPRFSDRAISYNPVDAQFLETPYYGSPVR